MDFRNDQNSVASQNWSSNPVPLELKNNQVEAEKAAGNENPVPPSINWDFPNFPPGTFFYFFSIDFE
jgi:hypothetical protein